MKKCKKCKKLKLETEFCKDKRIKNGYQGICKICRNKQNKKWRENNLGYNKKYRENNHEKYKEWRQTPKGRYSDYKRGSTAKRFGGFGITFEEFMTLWQKPCCYCGSKIKTIGLDRIDCNKGYSMDNVIPCCHKCNTLRMNLSREEFIKQIFKIAKHLQD